MSRGTARAGDRGELAATPRARRQVRVSSAAALVGAVLTVLVLSGCAAGGPAGVGSLTATPQPVPPTRQSPLDSPTATPRPGQESERTSASPAGRREQVEVGGRTLYLECHGASPPGQPTVILESGLGGSGVRAWDKVVAGVSPSHRVCTYDRAGVGRSDPPPTVPRTAIDLADDLAALLDAAVIPPPYLFVSHSLGPWVTTVFTADHPDAVMGLVLVDPRGPDVTEEWIAGLGVPTPGEPEVVTGFRSYATSFRSDPSSNDEVLDIPKSERQVRDALSSFPAFGATPLVVLRAAGTPDEWRELPPAEFDAWEAAWFDGHRALAAASSTGRIIEVADSGHVIQQDAPQIIVDIVLRFAGGG
ncbi:MAG TPA: alpha/beta hydrolase [Candidatus Limnocylindrales bacterium]|nr:alpha/beta hydrolase [Candidatus Limnocylindrales bacterium]